MFVTSLLAAVLLFAPPSPAPERHPSAPVETDHFAPLLGTWQVTGERLDRDGRTWRPMPHPAQWRFYRILNGHAIQDDWIEPAPSVDVPEDQRGYGTNLRIYDAKNQRWEMAWIHSSSREALTFTAVSTGAEIVMSSVGRDPPRRNVFFDITADAFGWRQEWTFDGGKSWVPVAVFRAKRAG